MSVLFCMLMYFNASELIRWCVNMSNPKPILVSVIILYYIFSVSLSN